MNMDFKQETNSKKSFFEEIRHIENLVEGLNQSQKNLIPLKIRHKSLLTNNCETKPLALIIGELHPGAKVNSINFQKANTTISNFLLKLYREKSCNLGDALKEGTSTIELNNEFKNFTFNDFIFNNLSPAITTKFLLAKENIEVNFLPAESQALLNKFALLSYLYCAFPGECISTELEQSRILNILNLSSSENIRECKVMVRELEKELFIHKEPFSLLIKKVKLLPDLEIFTLKHPNLIKGMDKEIMDLKFLIKSKIKQLCLERDRFIAMNFMKFDKGIHPVLVGELHVPNLIKLLEDQGVFCLYLSTL